MEWIWVVGSAVLILLLVIASLANMAGRESRWRDAKETRRHE